MKVKGKGSGVQVNARQGIEATERALEHLRLARDLLKKAEAPRALGRVRLAITSAEGAVRNAGYRHSRLEAEKSRQLSQVSGAR